MAGGSNTCARMSRQGVRRLQLRSRSEGSAWAASRANVAAPGGRRRESTTTWSASAASRSWSGPEGGQDRRHQRNLRSSSTESATTVWPRPSAQSGAARRTMRSVHTCLEKPGTKLHCMLISERQVPGGISGSGATTTARAGWVLASSPSVWKTSSSCAAESMAMARLSTLARSTPECASMAAARQTCFTARSMASASAPSRTTVAGMRAMASLSCVGSMSLTASASDGRRVPAWCRSRRGPTSRPRAFPSPRGPCAPTPRGWG